MRQAIHEKIILLLKEGKDSPSAIREAFKGTSKERVLKYRLSVYINRIMLRGGVIRVLKNGRNVIQYKLMNRDQFDDYGKFIKEIQSE